MLVAVARVPGEAFAWAGGVGEEDEEEGCDEASPATGECLAASSTAVPVLSAADVVAEPAFSAPRLSILCS